MLMELYRFKISPANKNSVMNFKEIEKNYYYFSVATKNCNIGLSFTRTGKQINIDKIEDDCIYLTLSSTAPLDAPTRTLSSFSRQLVSLDKEKNVLAPIIYNHCLFRTELIEVTKGTNIKSEDITSPELLKAIIDLLYTPTDNYNIVQKKKAISQIKEIMLPFIEQDSK